MKQLKARKSFLVWAIAMALTFAIAYAKPVAAAEFEAENTVWLHVVNGNFSGTYNGKELCNEPSVEVKLEADRTLPSDVKEVIAKRSNGKFDGWYTRAAIEVLEDRDNGEYCVWKTQKKNGNKIEPGSGKVPKDVNVLYAVFDDKEETQITDGDKLVVYYLDWNGINGRYGHCLTSIRGYNNGNVYFKAEGAAVFYLNYKGEFDKRFASASDKWEELRKIWEENEFDGYTFLGWSDTLHGDTIWKDTQIKNGMSFYAQWKKGELSSDDFEAGEDPDAGSLQTIRIIGDGLNTNLSTSRHAKAGESITLTLFRNPIRAKAKDVTWNLTIGKGRLKTEKVTVRADSTSVYYPNGGEGGLEFKAEGYTLTIKNLDGGEYGITVGATAKDFKEDEQTFSALANATVGFYHTWDRGRVTKEADCENSGEIHYTCTAQGCGKEKDEEISPLEHIYERSLDKPRCYEILEAPTCTKAGEKQYKCLRCGETNGLKASIPATGHNWEMTSSMPLNCQETQCTDTCTNDGCGTTRTREVKDSNPALHQWKETIIPMNCSKATLCNTCEVCGVTINATIDYRNLDGAHVWGEWKTATAPTLEAVGMQIRVCQLCQKEETKVLPQLAAGNYPAVKEEEPEKEEKTPSEETEGEVETSAEEAEMLISNVGKTSGADKSNPTGLNKVSGIVSDNKNNSAEREKRQKIENSVVKTGWQTIDGKKYYFNAKGVMQKNGIKTIDGKKYYFDKKGVMKTGWQTIGKKKYYFNAKGVMQTNSIKTINGKKYYFDKKGVMKTGWQTISKKKYYFDAKGVMQKNGFKTIKGKKYYFDKNGVMKTGKQTIGGKTYTFRSNGVLLK